LREFSLLEFFRTGKFGQVDLGMTRTEVKQLIGPPDDIWESDGRSIEESAIWIYGGIEFFWMGNIPGLHMISFQPWKLFEGGA
jgi:hypothetical protein